MAPSAVKDLVQRIGLPLVQPAKMKDPAFLETLRSTGARTFVVAAYGRILPKQLLEIPELTLNIHASILPRWRGAAPIQRAIMAGDEKTGISVMRLVEELDAGDVMLVRETPIDPNETAGDVEGRLAKMGADTLLEALDLLDQGKAEFIPQDSSGVTLAPPIETSEAKIDWNQSVRDVHNRVRALNPKPGAFTADPKRRIKILRTRINADVRAAAPVGSPQVQSHRLFVRCNDGWIEVLELLREGKSPQKVAEFLNGYRVSPEMRWS